MVETLRAVALLREAEVPVFAALVNRVIPEKADGEFLRRRREQEAKWLMAIDDQLHQASPAAHPIAGI